MHDAAGDASFRKRKDGVNDSFPFGKKAFTGFNVVVDFVAYLLL